MRGGELSRYFHTIFKEMVLLDISRKALKVAKCRLPSSLCVQDAHHLPFRDGVFSQVHALSVIEHLRNPEKFLREASRVLSGKGFLVVQVPNSCFLVELHTGMVLPFLMTRAIKNGIMSAASSGLYINWSVTRNNLLHKLSKLFTDVNVTEFNYPKEAISRPVRLLFGIAERLGLLSVFPMGYIIIARKV
jgi:ubiquinone/menaquinone biosynthesis C-methylase UbiE